MRRKQRYYNKARRTQDPQDWKKFKDLRKVWKNKLSEAHNEYVLELLNWSENKSTSSIGKKFWTYIKSIKRDNVGVGVLKTEGTDITDNHQKAEILNNHFKSVFTDEDITVFPDLGSSDIDDIPPLEFHAKGIVNLLKNINAKKANGPDGLSSWVLKEAAEEVAPFLTFIFNQSMSTGKVPSDWKNANVTPIFKKGNKAAACNYRPISLTAVPCKIMEHVIYHHIMAHLEEHQLLVNFQHGFR